MIKSLIIHLFKSSIHLSLINLRHLDFKKILVNSSLKLYLAYDNKKIIPISTAAKT